MAHGRYVRTAPKFQQLSNGSRQTQATCGVCVRLPCESRSASSEETKYEFGMHAPTGVRDARGGWMGGDVLEPCTLHVPAPSAALELYGYHRSPHPAASRGRRGAGLPRDRGPDADRRRATGTARLS